MSDLVSLRPPPAWKPQDGEELFEHLAFLHWCLQGGPLDHDLANRFRWAERRQIIETYEGLEAIPANEMATESAITRVRIVFAEISKLQQKVLATPDTVLDTREIMSGVEWMTQASRDFADRRADLLDWSSLTPEERETMLAAKEIQERLLRKAK